MNEDLFYVRVEVLEKEGSFDAGVALPTSDIALERLVGREYKIDSLVILVDHLEFLQIDVGEDIGILNLFAMGISLLDEFQTEAFLTYLKYDRLFDLVELLNLLVQIDDVCYFRYSEKIADASLNELYGRTVASEDTDLRSLQERGLDLYFDYEAFGEVAGSECCLWDKGYIPLHCSTPSLDLYSREELENIIVPKWNEAQYVM